MVIRVTAAKDVPVRVRVDVLLVLVVPAVVQTVAIMVVVHAKVTVCLVVLVPPTQVEQKFNIFKIIVWKNIRIVNRIRNRLTLNIDNDNNIWRSLYMAIDSGLTSSWATSDDFISAEQFNLLKADIKAAADARDYAIPNTAPADIAEGATVSYNDIVALRTYVNGIINYKQNGESSTDYAYTST